MVCDKCSKDQKIRGRTVTIYYGKIIREETKNYNTLISSKTVQKTYYKNIKNESVNICGECLEKHRKRKLITLPLKWLIPFIPFIYSSQAGNSPQENTVFYWIFYIVMLLVIMYTVISLIKKKYKDKPYKYDAYYLAKRLLKKKLKKANSKARYTFWREYPKHLTQVRY